MAKIKKLQASLKPQQSEKVLITNSQRALSISEASIKKMATLLMEGCQVRSHQLAIHFVSRPKIQALHQRFFQDPTATDCITLPYSSPQEEGAFLGEIFICPEVALTYAKRHGLNPHQELSLYLVHGFLHLMGFKDQTAPQRKQMRLEEAKWLDFLKKKSQI